MDERNKIRKTNTTTPMLTTLNDDINKGLRKHKTDSWRDFITMFDVRGNVSKMYKTINKLNGKSPPNMGNHAIPSNGRSLVGRREIANSFNTQYSSVARHVTSNNHHVSRKGSESCPKLTSSFSPLKHLKQL